MKELWITVEVTLGCDVGKAAEDSITLAQTLGVGINLPFNGVDLHVTEKSSAGEVVADYHRTLESMRYRDRIERAQIEDGERFEVGQEVKKIGGDYRFDGVVVAAFKKLSGLQRYVVEDDRGVLHISSKDNLAVR